MRLALVQYRDGTATAYVAGQVLQDTQEYVVIAPWWKNTGEEDTRTISRVRIVSIKTLVPQKG